MIDLFPKPFESCVNEVGDKGERGWSALEEGQQADVKPRGGKSVIHKINLWVLFLGKVAGVAADWVIVVVVLKIVNDAMSGCSDSCSFSGNSVCQDGHDLTTPSSLLCEGHPCHGNLSVLPAVCDYGTDCSDCGPRPPLDATASPDLIRVVALLVALAGTSVEVWAGARKFALGRERQSPTAFAVRSLLFNRRVILPRFFFNDCAL